MLLSNINSQYFYMLVAALGLYTLVFAIYMLVTGVAPSAEDRYGRIAHADSVLNAAAPSYIRFLLAVCVFVFFFQLQRECLRGV